MEKDEWIRRARSLLESIEFEGTYVDYGDDDEIWDIHECCPECRCQGTHDRYCELKKLLEEDAE